MEKTRYFALCDDGLQYIGECIDFHHADESAPGNTVWIFDESTAREWFDFLAAHLKGGQNEKI